MSTLLRPDFNDRSVEGLAATFRFFGQCEAPQLDSPLYEGLCYGAADDEALLAIAARAPVGQTPVNMMFAAVQFLLLQREGEALAAHYPTLSGCPVPTVQQAREEVFPLFRTFCLEHRQEIEALVASRRVQTNVIQRCVCLLPAFSTVAAQAAGRPLALVEIGSSAGLNLHWDRYRYTYRSPGSGRAAATWGDESSTVRLDTEVRGERMPPLAGAIPVAWRTGIDVRPVDVTDDDAVTWLRALIWPEHIERHARLAAAMSLARRYPPSLRRGDAVEVLPEVLAEAPSDTTLVVFATACLYQIARPPLKRLLQSMQRASRARPLDFVSMEGTGPGYDELTLTSYRDGGRSTRKLANCNPHGRWIEWLNDGAQEPPSAVS